MFFLLKLTCSPLRITGWEVTFLLGAGLFSFFFLFFGWLLWENRFRSPLHLTRPWRCMHRPETNLSSLKPWEAWVGNILSVLKNAKPGEQIEVPQDLCGPLFLVKEVQECSNGPDVWCVFKCGRDNCDLKWLEYSSCGIVCIRLHCFLQDFVCTNGHQDHAESQIDSARSAGLGTEKTVFHTHLWRCTFWRDTLNHGK